MADRKAELGPGLNMDRMVWFAFIPIIEAVAAACLNGSEERNERDDFRLKVTAEIRAATQNIDMVPSKSGYFDWPKMRAVLKSTFRILTERLEAADPKPKSSGYVAGYESALEAFDKDAEFDNPYTEESDEYRGYEEAVYDLTLK